MLRASLVAACLTAMAPGLSAAGAVPPQAAGLRGVVTALNGEVLLPGATVSAVPDGGGDPRTALTDDHGRFRLPGLPPGRWRVTASLPGFQEARAEAVVEAGREVELALDLQLAAVTETVVVRPEVRLDIGASLGSSGIVDAALLQEAPLGDVSVQAALPLVPGVVRGPDGISVKGGRPTQSSMQVGDADTTDPAIGDVEFRLPGDAVAQIEVLPNPYAVEYGRFSSGVTVIQPRRGANSWRLSLSDINPAVRTKRGRVFAPLGVESFQPRVAFSGPVAPGRLFLAQSVQLRYTNRDIRSRPQSDRVRRQGLASFTRLDARPAPGQTLTATLSLLPERRRSANLGTFDPPEVAANTRHHIYHANLGSENSLGTTLMLESLLHLKHYRVRVGGQGERPMIQTTTERVGHYFNSQERTGRAWQWRETLSNVVTGPLGTHFVKAGLDLERKALSGWSRQRPVVALGPNGEATRLVTFSGGDRFVGDAADVAVFAQDRWQPREGLVVEAGIRADRDGVLERSVVSPRLGVRATLGSITIGGGVGRFVERTSLMTGAFESFESRSETRYGPGGDVIAGPTVYAPRFAGGGLEPARARTWHAEYHQQLTPALSIRASVLDRSGSHELVVEPEAGDSPGRAWVTLDDTGRSRYREGAVGLRYSRDRLVSADVSYVRSSSRARLSSLNAYFATLRDPFLRESQYGRADADVPSRVVAQLRGQAGAWRASAVLEVRNGLPYSAVNAWQDYVGAINGAGRLRWYQALDLQVNRRVRIGKLRPAVGVQVFNALDRFNPRDVQRNLADPTFGWLYNSDPVRFRLTVRF